MACVYKPNKIGKIFGMILILFAQIYVRNSYTYFIYVVWPTLQ